MTGLEPVTQTSTAQPVESLGGRVWPGHGENLAMPLDLRYNAQIMSSHSKNHASSGNVFADIGLPNADEHLIKAKLVLKINGLMRARGLKQVEAAELFGVKQPDISKMLRGDFRQFSVERLLRFLVALGQDVVIVVREHGEKGVPTLRVA